jgi:hypothetical protein
MMSKHTKQINLIKKNIFVSILAWAIFQPAVLMAEEEKKEERYVYATYFYCKTSGQDKADELIKANSAPVYDAAVADGTIKGWGWLTHHTGGKWRRIQYHSSDSLSGLLAAQDTIGERMEAAAGGADDGFSDICGAHDDYIWKSEAGSASDTKRGSAGLSMYHVCDIAKETRADEIVKKVFAPFYEKAVADGKLTSWGWSSHVVGGKYRRLGTMTAESFPGLLKAWGEILEAVYQDGKNEEAMEFSTICNSHSDYMWNIAHEKS